MDIKSFDPWFDQRDDKGKKAMLEMYEEFLEDKEFLSSLGIDIDNKRFEKICFGLDGTGVLWKKFCDFKQIYRKIINRILDHSSVKKLISIRNVSYKLTRDELDKLSDTNDCVIVRTPPIVSRYDHAKQVADMTLVIGILVNLPTKDLVYLYISALLHDVGHVIFSHEGDDFLQYFGRENHEYRCKPIITDVLRKYKQYKTSKICQIIQGTDPLGEILSLADTTAYLEHDRLSFGISSILGIILKLLSSIKEYTDGYLVFHNKDALEEILKIRYKMYKNIYCSPANNIRHSALMNILQLLVDEKLISVDDLENMSDMEIFMIIQNQINARLYLSDNQKLLRDLYSIFLGFWDIRQSGDWSHVSIDPEKAKQYFNIEKLKVLPLQELIAKDMQLTPYGKYHLFVTVPNKLHKKMTVRVNSEVVNVCYDEPHDPENKQVYIFFPFFMRERVEMLKFRIER